jgi:hypothetical protein
LGREGSMRESVACCITPSSPSTCPFIGSGEAPLDARLPSDHSITTPITSGKAVTTFITGLRQSIGTPFDGPSTIHSRSNRVRSKIRLVSHFLKADAERYRKGGIDITKGQLMMTLKLCKTQVSILRPKKKLGLSDISYWGRELPPCFLDQVWHSYHYIIFQERTRTRPFFISSLLHDVGSSPDKHPGDHYPFCEQFCKDG